MDEEESTERQMQIAMLCQRLAKMKKLYTDDDTDYINKAISSNSPDTCRTLLTSLERKGNPQTDPGLLSKLIDGYTRVFSSMPLGKYGQSESYAKMLVRFAELKAIQDVNDAQASFDIARSHCKDFAFVHVAYAQFELSQGNFKKCTLILQKAFEMNAKPRRVLEAAVRNLNFQSASRTELLHDGCFTCVSFTETTDIQQLISTDSPESCQIFLKNLEKRGDPGSDAAFLSKLLDCYSKVFARFPLAKHCKTESYARMLVRYAELKGIEDPEDAPDHFSIARSHCKAFAFVHIAHAQFELSQGNSRKSNLILQKALSSNARPVELLKTAVRNLNSGKTHLLPAEHEENANGTNVFGFAENVEALSNRKEEETPAKAPEEQQKPLAKETSSEWKIPALMHRHASPEDRKPPADPVSSSSSLHALRTPAPPRTHPSLSCQTPNANSSFVTPVVKQRPVVVSVPSTAQKMGHAPLPCTPQSQVSCTPASAFSNESITIKGKQFFIFKMIGRGGSSKVYQVFDHKKHAYALKYVNLEEADAQAVESYKNEIEHLNHLQQYSDQIIKLYDYEITSSYIYMLMECGHLDLNTWLRNRKSVNPLDRKCYWRNMLEAVHTIHKHGIVHSDLKPANFVIVDASLKLIDFGIANRIQPDVTSIMKDSQVGTLNYMPPEAIKDTSSNGKPGSKISAKGDVWSLGCILYCMTYGKTPFQNITNQISKIHAIIDPSHEIDFPHIPEKDLLDVLKRCLVRNPRERISIPELLDHPYLQLQPQPAPEPEACAGDLKRILNELAALQSPNSIARAASVSDDQSIIQHSGPFINKEEVIKEKQSK
uniref:Ttk protein kinase n=1 Tax=Cyprinus carpio carpio TaxID=630221 RepID=A0A9J7Z6I7_CYPCA